MKNVRKSRLFVVLSWLAVLVWAGLIFFFSAHSATDLHQGSGFVDALYQMLAKLQAQLLGPQVDFIDSCAHFCEYLVFGVLWLNALRCHLTLPRAALLAIVLTSLYGVSDEFHQIFVPGRVCDPMDWLVDTAGGLVGTGIFYLISHAFVAHRGGAFGVKKR